MTKKLARMGFLVFALAGVLASCAEKPREPAKPAQPTASDFKDPVITLESFVVPQYDGFWYFSKEVAPTKGDQGDRGAPLPMSFVFNIENPNSYPVLLEGFTFTVAFDSDFELITVNNQDACWLPAEKTDQLRVTTLITVRSALLSLMVTGGLKLQEKGWSPWDALERWWRGVPEFSVPVSVNAGAATFSADGLRKVVPFQASFP
jgi:hypothetical protein